MFFTKKKRIVRSLQINEDKCLGCGDCVQRCRRRVLDVNYNSKQYAAFVSYIEDCVGCGKCVSVCPVNAIELVLG